MSTPSIKVGQGNWGIKAGNLLGYANTEKKFSPVEFTSTRSLNTATRVNASGNIQAVNADIPRIDYFGGQASLLVESSSQNLARQSENFGTTWSAVNLIEFGSGSVLNSTGTLDPYGTNVADLIVANTTLAQHRIEQVLTYASGSYVFSVFLKAEGYGFARLRIGGQGATFNLFTGAIIGTDAGIVSSIQSFGNGWYRCIIVKTATAANETIRINILPTSSTADFEGNGTSGIYVFGAQYETGFAATSYIPTTTGTVTRNADVVSVTGVAGLIGQTEGTIYAEVDFRSFTSSLQRRIISLRVDGSNVLSLETNTAGNQFDFVAISGGVSVTASASGITTGIYKIAVGYNSATNGTALYVNGTLRDTKTIAIPNLSAAVFGLGVRGDGSAGTQLNDRIRAVSIYQTRLPNTTTDGSPSLQSITTL